MFLAPARTIPADRATSETRHVIENATLTTTFEPARDVFRRPNASTVEVLIPTFTVPAVPRSSCPSAQP